MYKPPQFSLKTLLIAMTLLCISMAGFGQSLMPIIRIFDESTALGVLFNYRFYLLLLSCSAFGAFCLLPFRRPKTGALIGAALCMAYFAFVFAVDLWVAKTW